MRVSRRFVDGAWVVVGLAMAVAAIAVLATTHHTAAARPVALARPVPAKAAAPKPTLPARPSAVTVAPTSSRSVVVVSRPRPALATLALNATTMSDEAARRTAVEQVLAAVVADPSLAGVARGILLDAARATRDPGVRALALLGVRLEGAHPADVANLLVFLHDPDVRVRRAVLHVVRAGGGGAHGEVAEAMVAALERETDERTARGLADALIDPAGGDPAAGLARLAASPAVQTSPGLARRVRAAQALVEAGITDGYAITRALDSLEENEHRR